MKNLARHKSDLEELIKKGARMRLDLLMRDPREAKIESYSAKEQENIKKARESFEKNYESWFTESRAVIEQIIPARLGDFLALYKVNNRKTIDVSNFSIQDWLLGLRATEDGLGRKRFDDLACVRLRFDTQYNILESSLARFQSSLFDIKQILQADMFDSELDSARELVAKGFSRSGGSLCGVIIEKHLQQICATHQLHIKKKNPTISEYNDLLKTGNVIDMQTWRFIQRLGDLRNLCSHNKQKEPSIIEVQELIDGTDKLIKTIF